MSSWKKSSRRRYSKKLLQNRPNLLPMIPIVRAEKAPGSKNRSHSDQGGLVVSLLAKQHSCSLYTQNEELTLYYVAMLFSQKVEKSFKTWTCARRFSWYFQFMQIESNVWQKAMQYHPLRSLLPFVFVVPLDRLAYFLTWYR